MLVADPVILSGVIGQSSHREVILGFSSANILHQISFADVLDEDTGSGYQRRFNSQHSLDFRKYIQTNGSSTIPLAFNLRSELKEFWRVEKGEGGIARVVVYAEGGRVLSQVDCQHRLGYLNDVEVQLPFMLYIGLTRREELEIFSVINSKAKGLSSSLLDFHDATLASDLGNERPELFISLYLNNNTESPWYRQLDLGGVSTSGLMRRASLRTMQKAVKRFISQSQVLQFYSVETAAKIVVDFWAAVAMILRQSWDNPRKYLVTKGVGVYSLMGIAADLCKEGYPRAFDKRYFVNKLSEFITDIDWSSEGDLKGFGGEAGVSLAMEVLRSARKKTAFKLVQNG